MHMCLRNLVLFQLPKAIYALKMLVLQKEYIISENHVRKIIFSVSLSLRFYAKAPNTSRIDVIAMKKEL